VRWLRIAFVISCVLCIGSVAMWARSPFRGDQVRWFGSNHALLLRSVGGMMVINWARAPGLALWRSSSRRFILESRPRDDFNAKFSAGDPWTRLGFWLQRDNVGWGNLAGKSTWIAIPHWFLSLLTASIAAWSGRKLRRNRAAVRWRAQGRCERCGYDIRATPDRCPECGQSVSVSLVTT
jgi:hypothetical protein